MTKTNDKAQTKPKKRVRGKRRAYILTSGHKFVIDDNGVVSLVDADNELLISVDNGKVFVAADKVQRVVEGDTPDIEDDEDAVTSIGEEWEDELFRQHNVHEKLIAQTKNAKPSSNWRAELDEL